MALEYVDESRPDLILPAFEILEGHPGQDQSLLDRSEHLAAIRIVGQHLADVMEIELELRLAVQRLLARSCGSSDAMRRSTKDRNATTFPIAEGARMASYMSASSIR